jgi:hypothetical protein
VQEQKRTPGANHDYFLPLILVMAAALANQEMGRRLASGEFSQKSLGEVALVMKRLYKKFIAEGGAATQEESAEVAGS